MKGVSILIILVEFIGSLNNLVATIGAPQSHKCAKFGTYSTSHGNFPMEGGWMFCVYPSAVQGGECTTDGFPLLSFEHGDLCGGWLLPHFYSSFLEYVASSGFVICAPKQCLYSCRDVQHLHQLHAITAAHKLSINGTLPIRKQGTVGVLGHSTGGMTSLRCAYAENVKEYNIGAAMLYNGDGGAEIAQDHIHFDRIDAFLPMLLVTGSADTTQPQGSTKSNLEEILKRNKGQPILTAEIDGEGHMDAQDLIPFLLPAPLKAAEYIVAFFGYTLAGSDKCNGLYKQILVDKLASVSGSYYDDRLFKSTV